MATYLEKKHKELTGGVGCCSRVLPNREFCNKPAYGLQEPKQRRFVECVKLRWRPARVPWLACYEHGGPANTNEQAQYLRNLLDKEDADAHWRGGEATDDKEHAKTIFDKVDAAIRKQEW